MTTTLTPLADGEIDLTIELTVEEFAPFLNRAASAISGEIKLEGFRPGKAPLEVVKARVGEPALLERAAELAIGNSYPAAVKEKNLVTIGYPKVDVMKLAPGNPFSFKARVPILPEVTLSDWRNVKIEQKAHEPVSDEMVNKGVEDLRKMTSTEKEVTRPAKTGDRVEIDFDIFVDQVPIEGGTSKNHDMELGAGQFIPGFEEGIVGLAPGQEKEYKFDFPKEYHAKHLAGRPADAKVKVHKVKEVVLPELNDQFAKKLGDMGSLLELKMKLRENLEHEAKQRADRQFELDVFDALIKAAKFGALPKVLLEDESEKILHEIEHDVQSQGGKFDDYLSSMKKTRDELKTELAPQAERRVKAALIVRHIAVSENVAATSDEVDKEVIEARASLPDKPEVKQQTETEDFRAYVKNRIIHRKVVELVKQALVKKSV